MPYIKRTVISGPVIETKKMMSSRIHTKGVARGKNTNPTGQAQSKVNERKAKEQLRWAINTNFGAGDLHCVLHYSDKKQSFEDCLRHLEIFLRELRKRCKRDGLPWKYITVTETKRLTNIHHHIILPGPVLEHVVPAWNKAIASGGVSFRFLDNRGNHAKLANYLIKESRSTVQRFEELGKRCRRYSCSKGLEKPQIQYQQVSAATWREEPKPRKGYFLYKFDDGSVAKTGWHEFNGYPWQQYVEVKIAQENIEKKRAG